MKKKNNKKFGNGFNYEYKYNSTCDYIQLGFLYIVVFGCLVALGLCLDYLLFH